MAPSRTSTRSRSGRAVKAPERFGQQPPTTSKPDAVSTRPAKASAGTGAGVSKRNSKPSAAASRKTPRRGAVNAAPAKAKGKGKAKPAPKAAAGAVGSTSTAKPSKGAAPATAAAKASATARYPSRRAAQQGAAAAAAAATGAKKILAVDGVTPADQIMATGWAPTAVLKTPRLPPANESPLKDLQKRKVEREKAAEQRRKRAERRASGLPSKIEVS